MRDRNVIEITSLYNSNFFNVTSIEYIFYINDII